MSDLDLDELRSELDDLAQPEKKGGRSPRDPVPTTLTTFLRAIARYRIRKFCIFVPVPTAIVGWAIALAAKYGWASGIAPGRFFSVTKLRMMDSTLGNAALGISARALADGMFAPAQRNPRGTDTSHLFHKEGTKPSRDRTIRARC